MAFDRGIAVGRMVPEEGTANYVTMCDTLRDELLVEQAKGGDMLAFELLVSRHRGKVLGTVYRITSHRQDAEDATQETFFRAHRGLRQFRGNSSFSTWLTRIAINQALQCLRKRRSCSKIWFDPSITTENGRVILDLMECRPNPEQEAMRSEKARMLHQAVCGLPQPFQRAFIMRYIDDCTTEEVAKELGISVAAVKSRVSRARRRLRERIGIL